MNTMDVIWFVNNSTVSGGVRTGGLGDGQETAAAHSALPDERQSGAGSRLVQGRQAAERVQQTGPHQNQKVYIYTKMGKKKKVLHVIPSWLSMNHCPAIELNQLSN